MTCWAADVEPCGRVPEHDPDAWRRFGHPHDMETRRGRTAGTALPAGRVPPARAPAAARGPGTAPPLDDLPSVTSPGQGPARPGTARQRPPSVTAAGLSLCNVSFRCAMRAEERLPDSVHAAHPGRSKLPMTWSPVTESNRRPSPYHGTQLPGRDLARYHAASRSGHVLGVIARSEPI